MAQFQALSWAWHEAFGLEEIHFSRKENRDSAKWSGPLKIIHSYRSAPITHIPNELLAPMF